MYHILERGIRMRGAKSPCRIIVGKRERRNQTYSCTRLMVVIVKAAVVLYGVYGVPGTVLALYLGHLT